MQNVFANASPSKAKNCALNASLPQNSFRSELKIIVRRNSPRLCNWMESLLRPSQRRAPRVQCAAFFFFWQSSTRLHLNSFRSLPRDCRTRTTPDPKILPQSSAQHRRRSRPENPDHQGEIQMNVQTDSDQLSDIVFDSRSTPHNCTRAIRTGSRRRRL